MINVILIAGEPAVGKTELLREVVLKNKAKPFRVMGIDGMAFGNNLIIGKYESDQFDGTDKLAMNIQPKFLNFLLRLKLKQKPVNVLLEGDRLINNKTITFLEREGITHTLIILTCEEQEHQERGLQRQQPEGFLKAKKTKTQNLAKNYKHTKIESTNKEHLAKNYAFLLGEISKNSTL